MKKHRCPHCRKITVELTLDEYKELRKGATTKTVVIEKVKLKSSRLTKRARNFLRRGADVPPALEEDWSTLRKSGMSSAEAAKSLGLVFFEPNARSE